MGMEVFTLQNQVKDKIMITLRNVLISQLRHAIGQLESPKPEEVEINILNTNFILSKEDLNKEVDPEKYDI